VSLFLSLTVSQFVFHRVSYFVFLCIIRLLLVVIARAVWEDSSPKCVEWDIELYSVSTCFIPPGLLIDGQILVNESVCAVRGLKKKNNNNNNRQ